MKFEATEKRKEAKKTKNALAELWNAAESPTEFFLKLLLLCRKQLGWTCSRLSSQSSGMSTG